LMLVFLFDNRVDSNCETDPKCRGQECPPYSVIGYPNVKGR
jgi:hypothetical protein